MEKSIEERLKPFRRSRDEMIPILQMIQDKEGYLSKESLKLVSRYLNIPLSKVYGVASFYNQFKFTAPGRYHIQICRGTACHVKGSSAILATLKRLLKIEPSQTTRDGLFSLEIVSCVGACSLAPVISINGEYFGKLTPKKVEDLVHHYSEKDKS